MKKLLSLLGAAGLLLAAGSSVMSFTYLDIATQSASTTTVLNSAFAENNINEVITTTDLGVVGSLDARLETKGGTLPNYYGMIEENLVPFIAESNPLLNEPGLQKRVHLEQST